MLVKYDLCIYFVLISCQTSTISWFTLIYVQYILDCVYYWTVPCVQASMYVNIYNKKCSPLVKNVSILLTFQSEVRIVLHPFPGIYWYFFFLFHSFSFAVRKLILFPMTQLWKLAVCPGKRQTEMCSDSSKG